MSIIRTLTGAITRAIRALFRSGPRPPGDVRAFEEFFGATEAGPDDD